MNNNEPPTEQPNDDTADERQPSIVNASPVACAGVFSPDLVNHGYGCNVSRSEFNIWGSEHPRKVNYPEMKQSGNTCVLLSIGGAVNYLSGTNLDENELSNRFNESLATERNFDTA